jgi:uncharacterized membrane protein
MAAFAGYFATVALSRHAAFGTNAQDLGYFDQAIWTTSRGQPLRLTIYDLNLAIPEHPSFLAYHVELLLALLAPLYWLWDDVRALLVLQPIVLAAAAVPAYLLGRHVLGSAWAGLAIGLLVLLHPTVQAAPLNDFHTVAFAPLLLLLALLALAQRHWWWLALWAGLSLLIKEHVGLIVALLGMAALLAGGRGRRPGSRAQVAIGAALLIGGLAWFVMSVAVVIPALAGRGQTVSPFLSRYGQYGSSLLAVILTLLTRPDLVWALAPKRDIAAYWSSLLLSGGLLPLLSPLALLAAPEVAVNSFSSFAAQRASATHYSLATVPVLVAAAAAGAAWLRCWLVRWRPSWSGASLALILVPALLLAALASIDRGFAPWARKHRTYEPEARHATALQWIDQVPAGAVVVAQDNLTPRLAHRPTIYHFAYGFTPPLVGTDPPPEWVLLDVTAAEDRADGRSLEYEAYTHPDYGVVAAADGYLLLRRGIADKALPPSFTRFALAAPAEAPGPLTVSADGRLRYLGARVDWTPDQWSHRGWFATVTTYWQAAQPLTSELELAVSRNLGERPLLGRSPTAIWFPTTSWPVDQTIQVVHGSVAVTQPEVVTVTARDPAATTPLITAPIPLTPPPAPGLAGALDAVLAALWSLGRGA